jgi:signal transduction histidine kinase
MPAAEDQTLHGHVRERFEARARALFYARLALMAIGLGVLIVPAWHRALNISMPVGVYFYIAILAYHVASYLWVGRRQARGVVFVTLCLDLLVLLYLVGASGGLKSPLMPAQLVFTMLFALLFPSPLYLIPPLLTLPVVAKIDQILGTQTLPGDLLVVLWYSALNVTVVYVMVYLEFRERAAFREVVRLQDQRRQADLERERTRLAREIHDSVGSALSGVLLQAEYLDSQELSPEVRAELQELRETASEGMEDLRRAVALMRQEFRLGSSIGELVEAFGQRHRLQVDADVAELPGLAAETQLVLFRVAQEALANVVRHAGAGRVGVRLGRERGQVVLSVQDDGRGFDPAAVPEGHYGLVNIRERADRLGGEVELRSAEGQGTRLTVRLPG